MRVVSLNPTTTLDAGAVVRDFIAALEARDVDRVLALSAPDIVYRNQGLPPARGREAFAKQMGAFLPRVTLFELVTHNLAVDGPIVLTERTDIIEVGRFRVELWVCGTFEVRDGQVVLWHDYFDFANATLGVLKGLVRALLGAAAGR